MQFNHRYAGSSSVSEGRDGSAMSFAPDTLRPPTYFRGRVRETVAFREAMSALHDVVVSDLRFQPKDRTAYLTWRATQDDVDLVAVARDRSKLADEMAAVQAKLQPLEKELFDAQRGFYDARARYWKYLYEKDRELWFKLDPVITVHPDQVFFECFSRDESSYGRLAASYDAFVELGDRACGTTNVDYSDGLYAEFQKLRSYKHTSLDVDPSGFGVATSGEDRFREVKIDVPETWVRGFLQVSSAMTLPAVTVDLHPMDLHNVCAVLRRNKELFGPRSLRYRLKPGEPVVIVVEPWNIEVRCPRSIYRGETASEIRVWGRRRLHILERLIPHARRVRVHLIGSGLPSFYVVDLGPLSFTLGLSGWTNNNWSESGNFDLMATREDVDDDTRQRVFAELGKQWLGSASELGATLGLAPTLVQSALAGWVQAGRAIYDLERGVYRKRELSREPLPVEKLRYANRKEEDAAIVLHHGKIHVEKVEIVDGNMRVTGRIQYKDRVSTTQLVLDSDRRLIDANCSCDDYIRNRLHKGPCLHMLALKAAERRGISDRIDLGRAKIIEAPATAPKSSPRPPQTSPTPPMPGATPRPPASDPPAPLQRSLWDWLVYFWQFVVAVFVGRPKRLGPPYERQTLRGVINETKRLGARVLDEDALLDELVAVNRTQMTPNGALFAIVAALKQSPHIMHLPDDQTLIAALRRKLA